ncbi:MAG TPA: portal protein [Buchnera sp. (in: enterobacteria)]|nr:portal protein [Buchnera sp. (in: enterobacteria)]
MNSLDNGISPEESEELESKRLDKIKEAGINEMDVLSNARDNLNLWGSYFNENITRGKDDMNFLFVDQWNSSERNEFTRLQKVSLTANKLLDSVNKILGEQRKNKPDLMVRSLTGKSDQKSIDLMSDLVRSISYKSQNDLIYQSASQSALSSGWGAFQISLDYESPLSFNRIINYEIIPDIKMVSFDPMAMKPHKGDGDFYARKYIYGKKQFDAMYPYAFNPVSYSDPSSLIDFQWQSKDSIVVCDYFVKKWKSFKILELSNGESVKEDEWKEMQETIKKTKQIAESSEKLSKEILELVPKIINERWTQDYEIFHYRLLHDRILDFSKWPSKYLPGIFVDGNSCFIEGRQYTRSFIREAKDTQKYLNFVMSERATEIKNRRREQWLATPDNIIGEEQMWRNPEVQVGVLIARPDQKTNMMPQKMQAWQLSPELIQEAQSASQDIREILGFSESQDLQGRDISGKARRERKIEGSMAAYIFYDNLNQAIEQGGRVVLDLIPYIYGEKERNVIITKKDGKTDSLVLNKKMSDGSVENEITYGDYDIEIDTGPSFAVQKEVALEFLQQTIQVFPQAFPLVADLWAKNLDVQFMPQISERFKTLVPPNILAQEEGKPPPPPKPSPQEQAMQMEMQLKQAELKERETELQLRSEKYQLEKDQHELEKMEMIMKAKKMAADMNMDVQDRKMNMHKADLDYSASLAKIMADLHTSKTKIST